MRLRFHLLVYFIFALIASEKIHAQQSDSLASDSSQRIVQSIHIAGNKKTKVEIILRELNFKSGDTLRADVLLEKMERSRKNLLNTSLFNFASIIETRTDSVYSDISITVRERWYFWPSPIFEIAEQNFNTWWQNGRNLQRANYGLYFVQENMRGRRETLMLKVRLGYNEQYGFSYTIPYLNKQQTWGMSFSGAYSRTHETPVRTQNNKLFFYKDRNRFVREEWGAVVGFSYRKDLYLRHLFEVRYTDARIVDTVFQLNESFFLTPENQMQYTTLSWRHIRDFRDLKPYPLRGHYSEFELAQIGLGILRNEPRFTMATITMRGFTELLPRVFAAGSVRMRVLVAERQPYALGRALGFSNYVRGYEYFVIDGSDYVLLKSGLRYAFIQPRILKIPFLPLEKFNMLHYALYGGIYVDAGYVSSDQSNVIRNNSLVNTWLFGYGIGLDFVTYYDTVVRFETGLNRQGQAGIFLHLNAGI
jgi:outer membrane protein assembly factor BamA